MRKPSLRFVVTLVVLTVAGLAAVFVGPALSDHGRSARLVLSTRFLDFGTVSVKTQDAEMLLTVRNAGDSTTSVNASMLQRHWKSVCPASLPGLVRMGECGFIPADASDQACDALKPGASCALAIDFRPRAALRYSARYCVDYASSDEPQHRQACLRLVGRGS